MLIRTIDDVAQLVRERRKQLGLTQGEVARRAGVSRQWVVALEKRKPTAEVSLVLKTLAALGLQVDVRDPAAHPGSSSAAAIIIDAGREVLEHHRPPGAALRTLSTRPPRKPAPPASKRKP